VVSVCVALRPLHPERTTDVASRVAFMRLGWGYAMLGPPAWLVMLHVLDGSPEQRGLLPLLTGAAAVASIFSLLVPEVVRRSTALRAWLLPPEALAPDVSEDQRRVARRRRESRAFEIHLVAWVLSLIAAAIPGMAGLMLGVTGHGLALPRALIAAAFVLTAIRFPTHSPIEAAIDTA
jgi:hypothetical protein